MKKILILSYLVTQSAIGFTQKLTLEEAINTGLQNRIELKNQQLLIQIAETENDKIKAKWLPQISASADMRANTQLQQNILPFAFGKNGIEAGESVIKFGRTFNNTLGLQAEQKIYDANKKLDQQLNATQVESQKNTLEQQRINIRQGITEAYYSAVFNKERISFAQKTLDRANTNLEIADARFKNGTILENDLNRFKLDVSNATLTLTKAKQDYALSIETLAYQMYAKPEGLDIATDLETILKATSLNQQTAYEQRPEIKSEEISIRSNDLNFLKQKTRNMPTVSAYGNYTALQQNNNFNPFAKDTWFPFNYVGIRANIALFDGKQVKLSQRDIRIRQQISQNNIEKYKADFANEARTTLKGLEQAKLDMAETQKNIELAKQILETDKFRYEKGVLQLSDLKNSEFSLQNAENNYLSSVYNFLVATVRYKKAVGLM